MSLGYRRVIRALRKKSEEENLQLALKAEYFHQIKAGAKREEFRLYNEYWRKRLEGKTFSKIVLTLGYPPKDDQSRRIERPWRGYEIQTITHPEFGDDPVQVFAIKL